MSKECKEFNETVDSILYDTLLAIDDLDKSEIDKCKIMTGFVIKLLEKIREQDERIFKVIKAVMEDIEKQRN